MCKVMDLYGPHDQDIYSSTLVLSQSEGLKEKCLECERSVKISFMKTYLECCKEARKIYDEQGGEEDDNER